MSVTPPLNTSFPILLFTADGRGNGGCYSMVLDHKLDTAVNGVRECVRLYVPPLVTRISPNTKLLFSTPPPSPVWFSGLRRTLFSFAFCSRSAGFNTHPRHATKQKCTTVGFHLSFVHFKRFSRDSTPGGRRWSSETRRCLCTHSLTD